MRTVILLKMLKYFFTLEGQIYFIHPMTFPLVLPWHTASWMSWNSILQVFPQRGGNTIDFVNLMTFTLALLSEPEVTLNPDDLYWCKHTTQTP